MTGKIPLSTENLCTSRISIVYLLLKIVILSSNYIQYFVLWVLWKTIEVELWGCNFLKYNAFLVMWAMMGLDQLFFVWKSFLIRCFSDWHNSSNPLRQCHPKNHTGKLILFSIKTFQIEGLLSRDIFKLYLKKYVSYTLHLE